MATQGDKLGGVENYLNEIEGARELALRLAMETGMLTQCPEHHTTYFVLGADRTKGVRPCCAIE